MMFRLFTKYLSINKAERKILNRIFFWLIYAFFLVRWIPLRWFTHLLGVNQLKNELEFDKDQLELVQIVKKNLRRCKKIVPWKVKCFEEAIAAKKVLQGLGISSTLYLGVNKSNKDELIAHAWLKNGSIFVTGELGAEKFKIVGFYT